MEVGSRHFGCVYVGGEVNSGLRGLEKISQKRWLPTPQQEAVESASAGVVWCRVGTDSRRKKLKISICLTLQDCHLGRVG